MSTPMWQQAYCDSKHIVTARRVKDFPHLSSSRNAIWTGKLILCCMRMRMNLRPDVYYITSLTLKLSCKINDEAFKVHSEDDWTQRIKWWLKGLFCHDFWYRVIFMFHISVSCNMLDILTFTVIKNLMIIWPLYRAFHILQLDFVVA